MTPNFDALAQQGRLFTRFYANGERSMDGLAALIAGIPTLPGTAYIGMGMEQNRMAYLGDMAQQGRIRDGLSAEQQAQLVPRRLDRRHGRLFNLSRRGRHPGDRPQRQHHRARRLGLRHLPRGQSPVRETPRKPFVGFIFTASTHLPFQSPGERWQKFAPDTLEHRFLNSLHYADWALGEFFTRGAPGRLLRQHHFHPHRRSRERLRRQGRRRAEHAPRPAAGDCARAQARHRGPHRRPRGRDPDARRTGRLARTAGRHRPLAARCAPRPHPRHPLRARQRDRAHRGPRLGGARPASCAWPPAPTVRSGRTSRRWRTGCSRCIKWPTRCCCTTRSSLRPTRRRSR
ncbi:MAG: sulfatase-like hydrolase/transferase [Chromatiales bacterium]|nr:sulfatase-like hydrolase/transferase [Chromatiales bacterium]